MYLKSLKLLILIFTAKVLCHFLKHDEKEGRGRVLGAKFEPLYCIIIYFRGFKISWISD